MALAAAGYHDADKAALAWLMTQQDSDGGFPYQAGWGSDPNSDGLVEQALLATFQNPNSWSQSGNTVVSNLLSLQGTDGGFAYPGNSSEDTFTTAPLVAALERAPLPVLGKEVTSGTSFSGASPPPLAIGQLPALQCAEVGGIAPPASATPTPTPKATATPTPVSATPTPTLVPEAAAAATATPTPSAIPPLTGGAEIQPAAVANLSPGGGGVPSWLIYFLLACSSAFLVALAAFFRSRWT